MKTFSSQSPDVFMSILPRDPHAALNKKFRNEPEEGFVSILLYETAL